MSCEEHRVNFVFDSYGVARAALCTDCGERLSLGPSNDGRIGGVLSNIYIEIEAAHLENKDVLLIPGTLTGYIDHLGDADPPTDATIGWHIGWLVREMRVSACLGWPWDPSRPVAGQYEEWLATQQAKP